MSKATSHKDHYLNDFSKLSAELPGSSTPWIQELRKSAITSFDSQGFPTPKNELWKYTNVRPIVEKGFENTPDKPAELSVGALDKHLLKETFCHRLVFVDGKFSKNLSAIHKLPKGAFVGALDASLAEDNRCLKEHLSRSAVHEIGAFAALNTAFMQNGLFVVLEKDTVVDAPIHVLFLSTKAAEGKASYPRNIVVAGERSRATVIESFASVGGAIYFTNAVSEIHVAKEASVQHIRVQSESEAAYHLSLIESCVEQDGRFDSHVFSFGSSISRNEIRTKLAAEGAFCSLSGLYVGNDKQHIDNETEIDHAKPHCTSREFYKGILDGKARGVFSGKVVVRSDAQKSDAEQSNRNLLLSEDAEVDAKPQLEIYADDVKCSHGATVGQLDDEAIFYLRSRGIEEEEAKRLLTRAFALDVLSSVEVVELRAELERLIAENLERES